MQQLKQRFQSFFDNIGNDVREAVIVSHADPLVTLQAVIKYQEED